MKCERLTPRWIAVAILVGSVALVGWQIGVSRAADDATPGKSAGKKAPAAANDAFTVPEGKPPALVAFIAKMRRIKPLKTASEDDKKAFLIKSHTAMADAADKIMATNPVGNMRLVALKAKVEAYVVLDQQGDDQAKRKLNDLADELKDDKQVEVARLVKPFIGIAPKNEVAGAKAPEEPASWATIKPKLVAAPEDKALAQQAIQAVQSLEHSGASDEAVKAYHELGAILATSKDPQIAAAARGFDGVIRRLSLPGNPIEIKGNLVDGSPVNLSALKGKIVLVDFWATWCGPCKAELPNVLANYEKYHSKGFEVIGVSCDADKAVLDKFVADEKLPWPIIFQDPRQGQGMASYYGITGIPTAILTNEKGEVISLNARGPELTRNLEKLLGK